MSLLNQAMPYFKMIIGVLYWNFGWKVGVFSTYSWYTTFKELSTRFLPWNSIHEAYEGLALLWVSTCLERSLWPWYFPGRTPSDNGRGGREGRSARLRLDCPSGVEAAAQLPALACDLPCLTQGRHNVKHLWTLRQPAFSTRRLTSVWGFVKFWFLNPLVMMCF